EKSSHGRSRQGRDLHAVLPDHQGPAQHDDVKGDQEEDRGRYGLADLVLDLRPDVAHGRASWIAVERGAQVAGSGAGAGITVGLGAYVGSSDAKKVVQAASKASTVRSVVKPAALTVGPSR